mgnify:CR=1 FL=1
MQFTAEILMYHQVILSPDLDNSFPQKNTAISRIIRVEGRSDPGSIKQLIPS